MDTFLQILGSIASIGSIPLAIYLYLRSREAKFAKLKYAIVKVLSYQIGEGRELALFEVKAVIDSKVREAGLKSNSILVNDVIEDLVTETISNPLLDKERKNQIVRNFYNLYSHKEIKVKEDRLASNANINILNIENTSDTIEKNIIVTKKEDKPILITKKLSESFAIIASIATITALMSSKIFDSFFNDDFVNFLRDNQDTLLFALSISVSLVAFAITLLMNKYSKRKNNDKEEQSD